MAKSTHSQEILTGTSDSFTDHEMSDPHPPYVVRRAMLGVLKEGGESSLGTTYSEPSSDETQSDKTLNPDLQEPAQTTENPSDQTEKEDSGAPLMGGHGRRMEDPQSARKGTRKTPARRASSRAVPTDDDDFD